MDVELHGVTKQFGDTVALREVSYKVPAGKFITLLGPSGCGKTTFLRLIAGFSKPDTGDIVLGGEVITNLPANQRQIGMVFQNYALFPHMTVQQNVSFGLRMRHMPPSIIAARTQEMLDLVGLHDFGARYSHQLSGGQQQRVALARALAIQPRVLLLDEPFGALDRKLRLQMQVEVKKLIRHLGITTVFVTHDQEEAFTMSDQVAVMNAGEIVQDGTPTEIYDHPQDPFVADFVGGSNFLESEVIRSNGREVIMQHGEYTFSISHVTGIGVGQRAILVVRPENLRLMHASHAAEGLAGTISFIRPIGPMIEYEVETPSGVRLKVTTSRPRTDEVFPLGQAVTIALRDPEACTVFAR